MDKKIKRIINKNTMALQNSAKDFESLFNIIFANDGVLGETNDGFRIKEHSFNSVRRQIESVSAALYNKIGATGQFVGLDMDNSIEWIVCFWAILRSGNKPYLINSRHPVSLSNRILKTLGVRYVISLKETALDAETLFYGSLETDFAFAGAFENEVALSTSATSLKETICFFTGFEVSEQILNVLGFINKHDEIASTYNGRIKQLAFLPFYHVFGFIAVYFWFTFFGQTMVFLPDISSNTILKTCRKHKVTHIFAVPLLWHTIEKEIIQKASAQGENKLKKLNKGVKFCTFIQNIFPHLGMKLSQKIMHEVTDELFGSSVQFCISGGSYIKESTLTLINGIGYPLHNGYGMTETGITSVELRNRPKYRNMNSIGKPFSSVEYRINERGVLEIKGSSICRRRMVDGREIITDEWFETGDKMKNENGFYYILGREGDMVLGDNGENINPDVVEQCFYLPLAKNFSVLGLKSGSAENLSIVVEINKFTSPAKISQIMKTVYDGASSLDSSCTIKDFYFTFDPIMSASAVKVSRKYLANAISSGEVTLIPFNELKIDSESDLQINQALQEEITNILAGVLNMDPASISGDAHIMFDLGASSIDYFSFISLLAERFDVEYHSDKDAYCYTINDICKYLERFSL